MGRIVIFSLALSKKKDKPAKEEGEGGGRTFCFRSLETRSIFGYEYVFTTEKLCMSHKSM
jgi:hypothetical protein